MVNVWYFLQGNSINLYTSTQSVSRRGFLLLSVLYWLKKASVSNWSQILNFLRWRISLLLVFSFIQKILEKKCCIWSSNLLNCRWKSYHEQACNGSLFSVAAQQENFLFQMFDSEQLFSQVAYPYVAKRLLTDPNPALRERLIQVGFTYSSSESIVLHKNYFLEVWNLVGIATH